MSGINDRLKNIKTEDPNLDVDDIDEVDDIDDFDEVDDFDDIKYTDESVSEEETSPEVESVDNAEASVAVSNEDIDVAATQEVNIPKKQSNAPAKRHVSRADILKQKADSIPDDDEEKKRIKQEQVRQSIRDMKMKQKKERRGRLIFLGIMTAIFTIAVIYGVLFFIMHTTSDKDEYRQKGIEAFNSGDYEGAQANFDKALAEKQWFTTDLDNDIKMYKAACFIRTSQFDEASAIYKDLYAKHIDNYSGEELSSLISLTDSLSRIMDGSTEVDLTYIQNEIDKGNKSLYIYLGAYYLNKGDKDAMADAYDKYLDSYGMNTYIAYQMSTYYLSKNNLADAESYISRGLTCDDKSYVDLVRFNEVVLCEKNLDYQGAFEKMEVLLNDYPENEKFQKEYDFLYTRVNYDSTPVHTEGDAEEE